jgi:hypothetical protein
MHMHKFMHTHVYTHTHRSLWKHAPWIRHVYIVTNGQIPYWLNTQHPKLTVVPHSEIFRYVCVCVCVCVYTGSTLNNLHMLCACVPM